MGEAQTASRKETLGVGAVAAAIGGYFLLVGAGLLPLPGGPRNLHAPLWIVLCVGLAFFLAGVSVVVQGLGRATASGELAPDAPAWMRLVQYLAGVAVFVTFAVIGSWVAFAPGPRAFSGSFMFFAPEINAWIGRVIFAFGAILTWFATALFAIYGARRLRRDSGA